MASAAIDPVKSLFESLPPLQLYDDELQARGTWRGAYSLLKICLHQFIDLCHKIPTTPTGFADPDTSYLYTKVAALLAQPQVDVEGCDVLFLSVLADVALKYGRTPNDIPDDGSKKMHYLRHVSWMVRGRRDDEKPTTPTAAGPRTQLSREYYASLTTQTAKQIKCANCGNSDKELERCTGCLVDEDWAYLAVAYCSKECQKAHWKTHKDVCRDRMRLARACSVARSLSQQFQMRTFDYAYAEIKVEDGTMLLREFSEGHSKQRDVTIIPDAFKGGFIFRQPPQNVCGPDSIDSEDYDRAIIQYSGCHEHTSVQWPFIGMFLEPISKSMAEIQLTPKNASIAVSHVVNFGIFNGALAQHEVLCATMPSGEKFIIDLSGGQFGWHENLSLARDFLTTRSARVTKSGPLGLNQETEDGMRMAAPVDCIERMGYKLKKEVAAIMASKIKDFLSSEGFTGPSAITDMLGTKETDFDACLQRLLHATDTAMTAVLDEYMAQGLYRLCLTRKETVRVTIRARDAATYRGIWLTEKEWAPIRDKPDKLLKLWKAKVKRSSRGKWIKPGLDVTQQRDANGKLVNVIDLKGIPDFPEELITVAERLGFKVNGAANASK